MKFIKWFGNPYVFISLYLLLIIEGDNFGGFYLIYLFLAIPHGLLYAILSAAGIVLLICGCVTKLPFKRIVIIIGLALMVTALFIFFSRGNKQETFAIGLPLLTFIIWIASGIALLVTRILNNLSLKQS